MYKTMKTSELCKIRFREIDNMLMCNNFLGLIMKKYINPKIIYDYKQQRKFKAKVLLNIRAIDKELKRRHYNIIKFKKA